MILHLTWTLFNDIITLLFAFAKNSAKVASSKSAATHNSIQVMPSVVSFFLSAKRFLQHYIDFFPLFAPHNPN